MMFELKRPNHGFAPSRWLGFAVTFIGAQVWRLVAGLG